MAFVPILRLQKNQYQTIKRNYKSNVYGKTFRKRYSTTSSLATDIGDSPLSL
jgi:hypothetical protein